MQTSKKILLTVTGAFIALLIISLIFMRTDLQSLLDKAKLESNYQLVPVEKFESLEFPDRYSVKIRQGKEYKVELSMEKGATLEPSLENRDGRLYFRMASSNPKARSGIIHAKITAPFLKEIKAGRDTKIYIENFEADTLNVILENSEGFSSKNNYFKHLTFKTSGNVDLEFSDEYNY